MSELRSRAGMWGMLLAAGTSVLAGCAAGPDFERPPPPSVERYTASEPERIAGEPGQDDQVLHKGAGLAPAWWQAFGSPALDEVVHLALAASPTLDSARATVAQAAALVMAARGAAYPQLNVSGSGAWYDTAQGTPIATRNAFQLGVNASVDADVAGGIARRVEQAQALADFQLAQWRAAQLALQGNVVLQSLALATAVEQIAAVNDIIAVDERNLELVGISATAGKSAQLDVLTAQSQLASDRALLPPLQQQASVARHALSVLAGKTAAQWSPPDFDLSMFALPRDLPLALPSQLVRRHPDIVAAEAQLHAANAAIGVAGAQLYPALTLSAGWTAAAASPGGVLGGANHLATLAAGVLAPVFNGYTLAAQRDAAIAAYAAQLGNYRQTLLQVFGRVADALSALSNDAQQLAAQRKALETASRVVGLTQESYEAGQASLLQLLESQRLYQQARLGHARARGQRYANTAQLFIALGGTQDLPDTLPRLQDKEGP